MPLTVFDLSSPVHWQPSRGQLMKKERIFLWVALSGKCPKTKGVTIFNIISLFVL